MNFDNRSNNQERNSNFQQRGPNQTGDFQAQRPRRPYDPTDNMGCGYKNSYVIFPDYWKQAWGYRPILGYVRADSVFYARYAAYNAGLLPMNGPFGPEPVLQIRRYQQPQQPG